MKCSPSSPSRGGLTIVELMVTVGMLGILFQAVYSVLDALAGGYRSGTSRMEIDATGSRVMRAVTAGLRMADLESIDDLPQVPFFGTTFDYNRSLEFDGVQTIWSGTEVFAYSPAEGTLTLTRAPGQPEERVLLRVDGVPPMLAGEQPNGLDDNGNGLVDEPGFCASLEGSLLTVWLTLRGEDHQHREIERTWTTSVRCRN